MDLHVILTFAGLCAVISVMPGPNAMMTMAQGITNGARGAVWTIAGSILCLAGFMLISALGAGAILMASPTLFEVVRWGGVAYLVFLAIQAWRAPPMVAQAGEAEKRASIAALFAKGFATSLSNPKAVLFWGALFPPFLDPAVSVGLQIAVLGAIAFSIELAVMLGYGLGAAFLSRELAKRGKTTIFNKVSGGAMLGAAAFLAAK